MPGGLHPPLDVIASWDFNYVDPPTSGGYIVVIVGVLLGLAYISVALRLVARLHFQKTFGVDDALIIFNMLPLTGMSVAIILAMTKYGFNKHVWNVETPVLIQARKITLSIEMMYMASTCTTKISILLFYRRLASDTISRRFLYFVYATIAYVAVYFFVWFFALFGICRPLRAYWMMADYIWYAENESLIHCLPENNMLLACAIISATQDFLACGLPMILMWKLQMPRRTKIALGCLFSVGFFLCVCAILRAYYVWRVYNDTYDMLEGAQPAWLWLAIEAELAIVCASVPALRKFFQGLSGALSTRSGSSNSYGDNNRYPDSEKGQFQAAEKDPYPDTEQGHFSRVRKGRFDDIEEGEFPDGEDDQLPDHLSTPERNADLRPVETRDATFYSDESGGSEQEIVTYEPSEDTRSAAVGGTFYDDDTIDFSRK